MSSREPHAGRGAEASGRVLGVVLAAGAGSRFGMPKILAHQGDWLRSAVAALHDGGCDEVVVAMGAAAVAVPRGASALVVENWADGLSASVSAAIGAARQRAVSANVLLHVVDMPDVGADVVARVLAAAQGRPDVLVRAQFDGAPSHPVYLGADHLPGVLAVLRGDVGAQTYLRRRNDVLGVECGDLASGRDRDVE
ncbi:nucleotidyltransferase family protein [Gordonia bronchialis]|uniref:nucleotidyltransferase family protein n=1 Tax=Gordonia bronchialis TaxID=2054 RepID=UPI00242D6757|nr:NTP transferase domain-containing protein [Gordonia bronchialis]